VLAGLPMWGASRSADLVTLQFGERRTVPGRDGGERTVGTCALHIACPWRLAAPDRVLVGSGDLLTPADPDADLDTFDWDEPGASWLDVRLGELAEAHAADPPVVEAATADEYGGLQLSLTGGLALELFPNSTPTGHVSTEFWRLLRPGTTDPHFVVGTFGVEREQADADER
jgi:hypothetical protein